MKYGVREGTRTARIVALVKSGLETSRQIADALGIQNIGMISSEMYRIEELGVFRRLPARAGRRGRPCVRWRVIEVAQ